MSTPLDMDRIAKDLGAERCGKVAARGGYFGAVQLAAEVAARFRVPEGGGRPTDPSWKEQRLVRVSPTTLERLETLARKAHASPMRVAAILLEQAVQAVAGQEEYTPNRPHVGLVHRAGGRRHAPAWQHNDDGPAVGQRGEAPLHPPYKTDPAFPCLITDAGTSRAGRTSLPSSPPPAGRSSRPNSGGDACTRR